MFVEPLLRQAVCCGITAEDTVGPREVKSIVTEEYPLAEKVVIVMDNLNTHTISSLYETFPVEKAFAIA
jgi:hypothetical protein